MTGAHYFVDTNIFIYSIGEEHPLKPACTKVIQSIREGRVKAILNTEIVQEIIYRFHSIKKLSLGISLARDVMSVCSQILPIHEKDLSLALELLEAYPRIATRDAFHAATMINYGIKEIISVDRHFDLIPKINRIDPASFAG